MVIDRKDTDDKVIAWVEYRVVNALGAECPEGGLKEHYDYGWINNVWIHKSYRTKNRFNNILRELTDEAHKITPWVKHMYWKRGKYDWRESCYDIRRIKDDALQKV